MDDVIGKPFEPETLIRAVAAHVRTCPSDRTQAAASPAPARAWPTVPGIDTANAADQLGNDSALFCRLLARMLPEELAWLEPAAASGRPDLASWASRAHRLRGAATTLGARRVGALAGGLEAASRQGDEIAARTALLSLMEGVQKLQVDAQPALQVWAAEHEAALRATPQGAWPAADEFAALLHSLHACDLSATSQFDRLRPGLRAQLGPSAYAELDELIATLRFAEAAALLDPGAHRPAGA
ncbi:Hpt domain-containing protein [Aquabacterium sp. J223]|uniref:Hpt domain-containing protein n=1 Tax=Aquabacterium sp. J223 TaxID=2898431 RepID=UPI0021AD79DF|nr:Hpt domain-containing protein [Aquabacterium sp. J223]UUX94559.1 hypothetical protein LRS07_14765 [Aquabacterium sp. J223]